MWVGTLRQAKAGGWNPSASQRRWDPSTSQSGSLDHRRVDNLFVSVISLFPFFLQVADLEDIGCDAKKLIVLRAALLTAQRLRAVVDSLDPEGHDCFLRALRFWLRLPWFVRWPLAKAIESDPKRQQIAWILHGIDLGMNNANYQSLLKRKELLR